MNYQMMRKKGPATIRSGSHGFNKTPTAGNYNSNGFHKPVLDPKKITTNKKFDEIPDDKSHAGKKPPAKPKLLKQPLHKEEKVEKPVTDKLTNIAVDAKNNTATEIERRIDRLHTGPKEVTQKPNFGRFTSQQPQTQMHQANPYV